MTLDGILLYLNPVMEQLLGRGAHLFDADAELWLRCVREIGRAHV